MPPKHCEKLALELLRTVNRCNLKATLPAQLLDAMGRHYDEALAACFCRLIQRDIDAGQPWEDYGGVAKLAMVRAR